MFRTKKASSGETDVKSHWMLQIASNSQSNAKLASDKPQPVDKASMQNLIEEFKRPESDRIADSSASSDS